METKDIELIADTLCNIFDWGSDDLEKEFIECLKDNEIDISQELALSLVHNYLKLDTKERSSPQFDYNKFISNHCTL